MSDYYDQYDYPQFWEGREYEHCCEVIAIQKFLHRIPRINRLIDVGAGYGRLSPYYIYRARRSVLIDSSAKLLKLARQKIMLLDEKRAENVKYVHIKAQKVSKKVKNGTFDVVVCVRILHHIENTGDAFSIVNKLLKKNGYLILEFPNKLHGKARARYLFRTPLPHINFHPLEVQNELKKQGFEIIEKRSVSNIRSSFLKRHLPVSVLLLLEDLLQKPLSNLNFGPSIFILARKRG
jgi:SAM-dependent methyltransferase